MEERNINYSLADIINHYREGTLAVVSDEDLDKGVGAISAMVGSRSIILMYENEEMAVFLAQYLEYLSEVSDALIMENNARKSSD